MNLPSILSRARTSGFTRWWLNVMLARTIPFNAPHGFKVRPLTSGGMQVHIPYWRINRNHIRGLHACALATGAEMCSGLSLLEHLDPERYRLIMRSLRMDYHYQAKCAAVATATPSAGTIAQEVVDRLAQQEAVDFTGTVMVHDVRGNHLATGTITWQVKSWGTVRTRR